MKVKYTRQYDITLTDDEMNRLVQILRIYVRDYEAWTEDVQLLADLEDDYHGETGGRAVTPAGVT